MKIVDRYSHMNGEEYLLIHRNQIYSELLGSIERVNISNYQSKISKEKSKTGGYLYRSGKISKEFMKILHKNGWDPIRRSYRITKDYQVKTVIEPLTVEQYQKLLESQNAYSIHSSDQIIFVKDKVAVDVQLRDGFSVSYDFFDNYLAYYSDGFINVGVEIVSSIDAQGFMCRSPQCVKKEARKISINNRNEPPVPMVIIAIKQS
jgi:hypothetical protein